MEKRVARYMMDKTERKEYNKHHVIGQVNKDIYNVFDKKNMISVEVSQHRGYNSFVRDRQSPRGLFLTAYEWTAQVLTEKARDMLYELINMPDEELYIQEVLKKKTKREETKAID